MSDILASRKIPLPAFLKMLTSNNITMPKAMAVASKVYKDFNTAEQLAELTDVKLNALGVDDKETRKLALSALRKAGYAPARQPLSATTGEKSPKKRANRSEQNGDTPEAGPSQPRAALSTVEVVSTPVRKRRKRDDDLNEFLPDGPADEAATYGSLEFDEVLDEEILRTKSTVVNRAPLMTAWATVVAERLGFQREEALSIASVYTEMNAISKGISLGIFNKSKNDNMKAGGTGSQPYVDIMGRRPLYQTQNEQWRALSNNIPAQPSSAFSYISRAFRQTTPHILGALRLLAETYAPHELNRNGFALYAEFRPSVDGWGKRGEVTCDRILALRKEGAATHGDAGGGGSAGSKLDVVETQSLHQSNSAQDPFSGDTRSDSDHPDARNSHAMTLEEYEEMLDEDHTFDDVDLDIKAESTT